MADKTLIYVGAEARGLYRKEAGDKEWTPLTGLHPGPQVRAIDIDPRDTRNIFVGTQRGVYRSQDRGDTWQRMNMPEGRTIWSLHRHPNDANTLYAGTEGAEVYISKDSGESWALQGTIHNPYNVEMSWSPRIFTLAVNSKYPDDMYAAIEVGGAIRSSDGGKTWEFVSNEFIGDIDKMDVHAIRVGGDDSQTLFLGNRLGVWKSRDRGEHWENQHLENFSPIVYSRTVQVAPDDPNTVYSGVGIDFGGDKGGIIRTKDGGKTWQRLDNAPSGATTFGLTINRHDTQQIYFCSRRGQVFGSHDGGHSWNEHVLPDTAKDVISVAVASA